jgi:hypothetical protein
MNHAYLKYFVFLLIATIPDPVRCGVPIIIAAETPPGVIIIQGKTREGFPYLSGGVSSDEREIVEETGKAYNVKLSFAEKRGPYLSDVRLVIQDAKGAEVIALTTNGPLFYIQLPSGRYAVKATFNGMSREIKHLEVTKGKVIQRTLTWDLDEQS